MNSVKVGILQLFNIFFARKLKRILVFDRFYGRKKID